MSRQMKLNQPQYQQPSKVFWVLLIIIVTTMISAIFNKVYGQNVARPIVYDYAGTGVDIYQAYTPEGEAVFLQWNTVDSGFLLSGQSVMVQNKVSNLGVMYPGNDKPIIVQDRDYRKPITRTRDIPTKYVPKNSQR